MEKRGVWKREDEDSLSPHMYQALVWGPVERGMKNRSWRSNNLWGKEWGCVCTNGTISANSGLGEKVLHRDENKAILYPEFLLLSYSTPCCHWTQFRLGDPRAAANPVALLGRNSWRDHSQQKWCWPHQCGNQSWGTEVPLLSNPCETQWRETGRVALTQEGIRALPFWW